MFLDSDFMLSSCFQVNVELLGNTGDGMMNVDPSLWQQNIGTPQAVPETVTVTLTQNPGEGQCHIASLSFHQDNLSV